MFLTSQYPIGLVEPDWLQERLGKVRVLDATLHLDHSRNAAMEFKEVFGN